MLNRVFGGTSNGFYIDIGAWDDTLHSVTKHFYDSGWSGINVEPVKTYYLNLLNTRPRDTNLNIVILDKPGQTAIFEIPETGLSTADPTVIADHEKRGISHIKHEIEAKTLEQICIEHVNKREIDFLKVDTEGTEHMVLLGGNWTLYRPKIIVIEATQPNSSTQNSQQWEPFILSKGYIHAYFDGLNKFYVRSENPDLLVHFSTPPNVFDGFTPHSTLIANQRIDSLELRINSAIKKADKYDKIQSTVIGKLLCRLL